MKHIPTPIRLVAPAEVHFASTQLAVEPARPQLVPAIIHVLLKAVYKNKEKRSNSYALECSSHISDILLAFGNLASIALGHSLSIEQLFRHLLRVCESESWLSITHNQ